MNFDLNHITKVSQYLCSVNLLEQEKELNKNDPISLKFFKKCL